ncbi:MAG TPA: hypothetical protein VHB25_12960 [Gemmatimonadaceae bacterium]|nr:hypothetical protein [Gemmatimonadaceae bacterium]
MALKFGRWIGLLALGCLIVWLWVFHGHPAAPIDTSSQIDLRIPAARRHLNEVARRLSQTNDRLRQLEIRDSLAARYGSHASPGLTVAIDNSVPPRISAEFERLVRAKWDRLGIHSSAPVLIAVVLDSATTAHGFPRRYMNVSSNPISVFLPRQADAPCISVLRMNASFSKMLPQLRVMVTQTLESPETIDAVLGPCAYLASFGAPGPQIAGWLRNGGWSLARLAAWDSASPPWTPRSDRNAYWFRDQLATIGDPNWQTRQVIGLPGLACIAGEAGRCAEAAGASAKSTASDTAWTNAVVSTRGASAYFLLFAIRPSPLGAGESRLVSDMVRSLGDSSFRHFWTSDQSVTQAFSDASGQSLDTWVRAWARKTYGRVPAGPSVPLLGFIAGTVALLAGLLLATVLEQRRRVA